MGVSSGRPISLQSPRMLTDGTSAARVPRAIYRSDLQPAETAAPRPARARLEDDVIQSRHLKMEIRGTND